MKTVHVIGSKTHGGAERFYLRLIRAIHERKVDTVAFVRRNCDFIDEIDKGIYVFQLPMRTVWDPLSKREISTAINKVKPDIVQTYMGRATRLTHIPKNRGIVHIARLGNYYKLNGYHHAHAWIGNTRGICDYLIRNGMPSDRVFHIYNFIDIPPASDDQQLTRMRSTLGIPETALVLVTTGRFSKIKGHSALIEAFAKLPVEFAGRPVWLLMVGDGVLFDSLQSQAKVLGIGDRICWTGWQANPDLYYQLADVAVFPFLEQEPFGNVILEAWAYRVPVVTTLFKGAHEFISHGQDAWCAPCNDVEALADGIITLLHDQGLRDVLSAGGYRKIQRDFSKQNIVDQYLALYNRLTGGY